MLIEEANAFLPKFLEEFNQKFKRQAQNPINAHRPLLDTQDLDRIFCLKHTRRISQNLTLQYGGVLYQIYAEKAEYTLRNKEITICEYRDGKVRFEDNGKVLNAIPYKEISAPTEEISSKELLTTLMDKENTKGRKKVYKPGSNHPWKQSSRRSTRNFCYL